MCPALTARESAGLPCPASLRSLSFYLSLQISSQMWYLVPVSSPTVCLSTCSTEGQTRREGGGEVYPLLAGGAPNPKKLEKKQKNLEKNAPKSQ